MKTVLVTGATGFIGRFTLPLLLERGYKVYGVTFQGENGFRDGVYWLKADMCQTDDVKRVVQEAKASHLLHFAWITEPGVYWNSPENTQWLECGKLLAREFGEECGKRAVFAGTCAEYDWAHSQLHEDKTPLTPHTLYGETKLNLSRKLGEISLEQGWSSAWGRIFLVYGPYEGQNRFVPAVIKSLLKKEKGKYSSGTQVRDFLYVKDVADAFVTLLESEEVGEFNISSGQGISLIDFAKKISGQLDNFDCLEFGALPDRKDDPAELIGDIKLFKNKLCWCPRYSIEEGISETINWWQDYYKVN
jgi:nucleoside-diphosphate-sugar epimerase